MLWQSFEEKMSSEEIEAITKKITDRDYEVPHIDDPYSWDKLETNGVLTGPEIVKIRKVILSSAPTAQQPGK